MFSLVRRLSTRHCPHLLLSAVLRAPLLLGAGAVDLYLLPARRSAANPRTPLLLSIDGTDGRTDRQTLDRFIDPAPHAMQAVSTNYSVYVVSPTDDSAMRNK